MIEMEAGDIVIFSNTCPHRSKKIRQIKIDELFTILFYKKNGSQYQKYFEDKKRSKKYFESFIR